MFNQLPKGVFKKADQILNGVGFMKLFAETKMETQTPVRDVCVNFQQVMSFALRRANPLRDEVAFA